MTMQERAVRTRFQFVRAAAELFAENGYHNTSLAQVCLTVDHSMGALTFHFHTKSELADAVEEAGRTRLAAALMAAGERVGSLPPLAGVARLSVACAELLDTDCTVRAALTLARDRKHPDLLSEVWVPLIGELIDVAFDQGHISAGVSRETVRSLAEYLVRGAASRNGTNRSGAQNLARLWRAVCGGLSVGADGADPGSNAELLWKNMYERGEDLEILWHTSRIQPALRTGDPLRRNPLTG
ncbi:TetR/AcrR family transcriptional regulator [Streptomyces sp. ISL-43]|uniref:TetR/AcrR family transcriptional regulator n=1 Tax=Streptomyces sp. ISL-43 TaxID=2819183 RepID=UPI001BE88C8A|nr:TetR/AcrR family transcriptional regulator [Streptomyces sp. ISL-43]MBT2446157.1 TetR/AcrR family transcriptional regulator [Streptomyces sp. ISL-43]